MARGKKFNCCIFCDAKFPRRRRGEKEHPERFKELVESRIAHLNEKHYGKEIREKVTLKNYRKYLCYSKDAS